MPDKREEQQPKWTPGPWTAHARFSGSENHKGWVILGDPQHKARHPVIGEIYPVNVDGDPSAEGRANKALVIAAPDLYVACSQLLKWSEIVNAHLEQRGLQVPESVRPEWADGLANRAQVALDKAGRG